MSYCKGRGMEWGERIVDILGNASTMSTLSTEFTGLNVFSTGLPDTAFLRANHQCLRHPAPSPFLTLCSEARLDMFLCAAYGL
jgi:hypothetical protein